MSLAITMPEIERLEKQYPQVAAEVKSLLGIKQALYDVLGNYPLNNVLPYDYGFELSDRLGTQVPANGTASASIKVTADAAFIACSIRGASTGDFLTFMRIDSSDRQLMNVATHSVALVGTGERPAPLHKPLLLEANTTVSFDITDLSGAANDVYFYLFGFKAYQTRTVG